MVRVNFVNTFVQKVAVLTFLLPLPTQGLESLMALIAWFLASVTAR